MKTVIQELIEAHKTFNDFDFFKYVSQNKELLLEKEKEQIMDAYYDGKQNGFQERAEEYYSEIFNKE